MKTTDERIDMTCKEIRYRGISIFLIFFMSLMLVSLPGKSQNKLTQAEIEIKSFFDQISKCKDDAEKMRINQGIITQFNEILEQRETFDYPFDSLRFVKILPSPDNRVRIITWNLAMNNGTHKYFGFIQQYQRSGNSINLYFLNDEFDLTTEPDRSVHSNRNWYGAIYYQIIPVKIDKETYYTLLGVDLNDLFTTKKLIDIMYFTGDEVLFGLPVFSDGENEINRVVFEYSAQVSMNLTYAASKKMIIFDHLAPSNPDFRGQYNHYGPDSSLDGFKFENEKWIYLPDLDINRIN